MDKTIKIVAAILAVVVIASIAIVFSGMPAEKDSGVSATDTIYFFYGAECPACHYVMPFVINMTKKYPEANIQLLEIWHNETNQQLYQEANAAAGITPSGVPEVIVGKTVLSGGVQIPDKFESLIQDYIKKKA